MKFSYIYIEREYASGGKEIAEKVAEALSLPCHGRDILETAARLRKTTVHNIEHMEETATSSFLYSAYMATRLAACRGGNNTGIADEETLNGLETKIILDFAEKGPAVFLGRCAGLALQKTGKPVLRVFIHAGTEFRLKRAIEYYGIEEKAASETLKSFDKRRSNYYHACTRKEWNDIGQYHLILDSGVLGTEAAVSVIAACAKGEALCL